MLLSDSIKEQLLKETSMTASRSGGPGGQNVNKVSTKVELRFPVEKSEILNDSQKQRILAKLKNRINKQGELIITSSSERTQWRNRQKAIKSFFELIEKALIIQPKRKKTKPTAASRLKRLQNKKFLSEKKSLRKPPEI